MLAYVTGSVDGELLARNEYLVTENRILRNQIKGRIRLTDPEPAWRRQLKGWDEKRLPKSRKSFDPKPFWRGTAG